jgi:nucleoside phosphorylase
VISFFAFLYMRSEADDWLAFAMAALQLHDGLTPPALNPTDLPVVHLRHPNYSSGLGERGYEAYPLDLSVSYVRMNIKAAFTHDDYTIAWICALPSEMAAAKLMLDDIHDELPQPSTDHNSYTLGRISGHNIAIACLPCGIYGITSAATVLAHMLPTFQSLRFGLMVGIGGGVPSGKADVRLGDVVVSIPTQLSSGVIQYDYGKTLHDGQFQRSGFLNKPPQTLLTAVTQIRSNDIIGAAKLEASITAALRKNQIANEQFSRPDRDWLFNPVYKHQGGDADCSKCDLHQLVSRATRSNSAPHIHYGLIASGNRVMKDAETRDTIARYMDVLCFEMEAAGLMDQLPCLVIRGICDYCDSHKHKQWQNYAALSAATYAKELLSIVPSTTDRRVQPGLSM